jgi:hypothetical protein
VRKLSLAHSSAGGISVATGEHLKLLNQMMDEHLP